jgi:ATP-binding cassette subfamily C protein
VLRGRAPQLAGAVLLAVCTSMTEGVAVLLLVPLMQSTGLDVGAGGVGQIQRAAAEAFRVAGLRPTLGVVLATFAAVACCRALLSSVQAVVNVRLVNAMIRDFRTSVYRAVVEANWAFLVRRRSAEFVHALTVDADRVGAATNHGLQLLAQAATTCIYVAVAARVSPGVTLLVCLCGAALLLIPSRSVRASRRLGEELSRAGAELYAAAIEHLGGVKAVKSFDATERSLAQFARLCAEVARHDVAGMRAHATAEWLSTSGAAVILGLLIYVGVEVAGLPAASILLLIFLFYRVAPRIVGLQANYQRIVHLLPAFEAARTLYRACEENAEPPGTAAAPVELLREIALEDVTFSYAPGEARALDGVDISVAAGRTTAIVGPSGSGKTTVADLVMGLLVPDGGSVAVDGVALGSETRHAWRGRIGYVAQDTFLFHDTVRANLLWARPDASDDEVWEALANAAAADFIAALPRGLETVVGDRGVLLSGGERQRLALARALLREPVLLILDEATSALDSENERRVQQAVDRLHGTTTILVITHRLSTIRGADYVYVLDGGRVVESGPWGDLVGNAAGRFRALFEAQNL